MLCVYVIMNAHTHTHTYQGKIFVMEYAAVTLLRQATTTTTTTCALARVIVRWSSIIALDRRVYGHLS